MKSYKDFEATELFCPKCKRPTKVRKKLLLILPTGDKYDYSCVICGTSVGEKMVTHRDDFRILLK